MEANEDPLEGMPWPGPVAPRPEVSDAIVRDCTRNLKKVRGPTVVQRLLLSVGSTAVALTAFFIASPGANVLIHDGVSSALYGVAAWGVVQAALLLFGLGRTRKWRASVRLRQLIAVAVPVCFFAVLLAGAGEWMPLREFFGNAGHRGNAFACALSALLVGSVASGVVLLVWRKTDPFTPGLSGSIAGLAGGLMGAVAVGAICPIREGWHLSVGHGLLVVAVGLIGYVLGRRALSP